MKASEICGKCEVVFGEDVQEDKDDWFMARSDRFYFFEAYDASNKAFVDPPAAARSVKNKGKVRIIICVAYVLQLAILHMNSLLT